MSDSFEKMSSDPNTTKVAVIGMGPSGIAATIAFIKNAERKPNNTKNDDWKENSKKIENNIEYVFVELYVCVVIMTLISLTELPFYRVVCFEKQSKIGGLWNYTWRPDVDEFGLPVHGSQYRHLWSNAPKEIHEFPDYTYNFHFKKNIGSYPPRTVIEAYLKGRANYFNVLNYNTSERSKKASKSLKIDVKFNHLVCDVAPIGKDDYSQYIVSYKDLKTNNDKIYGGNDIMKEIFDYIIVCNGHYSVPNVPNFEGFDTFEGRILHSHSYRNAYEFKDQNLLIIGSSYSGEDIGIQCWKFGCKSVTISYRNNKRDYKWPPGVEQVPFLKKLTNSFNGSGNTAEFVDGTTVSNIDAIILCTGYRFKYPFFNQNMRDNNNKNNNNKNNKNNKNKNSAEKPGGGDEKSDINSDKKNDSGDKKSYDKHMSLVNSDTSNVLKHGLACPPMLYKGCVNSYVPNIFYMGVPSLAYTFTAYDLQGMFIREIILGNIDLSGISTHDMLKDVKKWRDLENGLGAYVKDGKDVLYAKAAQLETDFLFEWVKQIGESTVFEDYLNYNKKCPNINGISCLDCTKKIHGWLMSKEENILEYRDICYKSQHDSTEAIKLNKPWKDIFDDTKEYYFTCVESRNDGDDTKDDHDNNNNNSNSKAENKNINEVVTRYYRSNSRDENEMEMMVGYIYILMHENNRSHLILS